MLMLALGLVAASALAQGSGEIQIEPPDGSAPVTLSLEDVDGSIDTRYPVRDADGNTRRIEITPENGASVDDFLKAAGFDEGYMYLQVGDVRLSRMAVRSGDGQGGLTPAIYVDEQGTHFVRPLTGPKDENESDIVTVTGPMLMRQSVTSTLQVEVKASKRKVAAGDAVRFSAEVRGGGVGDRFEFRWQFGDGSSVARSQRPRHSFDEAGRYRVRVRAETADDWANGAVRIEVGEPEESETDREGGGTNEADGAPSDGSYEGDGGDGSSYGSTGSFDYSSDDYATGDYGSDDYGSDDYATHDYPPLDDYPTDPAPAPRNLEPTVEGALLADISTAPSAATDAAARAARTGTPQDDPVDPAGVPTAVWALGTALGLLGVGAGLEAGRPGGLRRPWGPGAAATGRARLRRLLRR